MFPCWRLRHLNLWILLKTAGFIKKTAVFIRNCRFHHKPWISSKILNCCFFGFWNCSFWEFSNCDFCGFLKCSFCVDFETDFYGFRPISLGSFKIMYQLTSLKTIHKLTPFKTIWACDDELSNNWFLSRLFINWLLSILSS